MYSNCIFCSANLGSNESIERFPVGRSLAFDGAKGRLWAVCPRCARWNLAPIEERWEAIEEGERLFRDCRMRAQSENVGLAKLRDGTRLIRVGKVLPGEMAVVRYGRAYRRRYLASTGAQVTLGTVGVLGAAAYAPVLMGIVSPVVLAAWVWSMAVESNPELPSLVADRAWKLAGRTGKLFGPAGVRGGETISGAGRGERIPLTWAQMAGARLEPAGDGGFAVHLPAIDLRLEGWHAQALTARRLLRLNRGGGDSRDLQASVRMITGPFGAAAYVQRAARNGVQIGPDAAHHGVQALALEMALHEETERRAMDGELTMLEAMWREAEEIACIADRLPDDIAPSEPPRITSV
jgi:hypothetical protein